MMSLSAFRIIITAGLVILAFPELARGNETASTPMQDMSDKTRIPDVADPHPRDGEYQPKKNFQSNDWPENKTKTVAEPELLPTPQPRIWGLSEPHQTYARPYEALPRRPTMTSSNFDSWDMKQRFISTQTNEDYFYRNRKGEWIYVVPEHDFDHVVDLGYSFEGIRGGYGNTHDYLVKKEPDSSYSETFPSFRNSRFPTPAPSIRSTYSSTESVPFLAKLFNTGTDFLSMMNPLTYLMPKEPPPLQSKRNRDRYRTRPVFPSRPKYRKIPSTNGHQSGSLLSHFNHEYPDNDKRPTEKLRYKDYEYKDYIYVDGNYDYEEGFDTSDFNNDFKHGNYFDEPTTNKSSGVDFWPTPPPTYNPSGTKQELAEEADKKNVDSDYNNIYKFHDLEMLYVPQTIDNLKKVEDEHTLEYLKQNRLREDLYIGKDGNLYLKEKITIRQNDDGFQPYHIDRISQLQRPMERRIGIRTRRKQFPAYTTINRSRKDMAGQSYPMSS